ncbi:hypothetical protein GGF32_009440 [Allomyces javanicus]|nr:hypothetical protein GGF32_009440 [Allomyces javanicus]
MGKSPALPAHDPAPPVNNDPHDPVAAAIANQLAAALAGAAEGPPMHDHDMHDDGDEDEGTHDDEMEGGDNKNDGAPLFDPHAPRPNRRGRRQHKWTAEERQEIIRMYFEQNLSVKQIVHLLPVGNKSAVSRVIHDFEFGKLAPKPRGGERSRKVQGEHIEFLMGEVKENAALTLKQLRRRLYDRFDVDLTEETIARYLREENFVLKREGRGCC